MARLAFFALVLIHGLIHIMGFIKAFGLAAIDNLTQDIPKLQGVVWLLASLLLLATALLFLLKKDLWWIIGLIALLLSQVVIALTWQDAKLGTVPNVILLIAVILGMAFWNFNNQVAKETTAILAQNQMQANPITAEQIQDLPEPVKRWLQHSGILEADPIHTVYLRQKGLLRLKPDQEKWMEAEAQQYFTVNKPTFLWQVKTSMMGLPILGRDLFQEGKGSIQIKLGGLIPVVNVDGNKKVDQSTMQRFLGETVWFPTAALSPYIQWEAVDDTCAKATMTYEDTSGSAYFYIDEEGALTHFIAYRYKETTDEEPTEWMAKVVETKIVDGIRMPVKLEASWILDEGPFTWYTFEIYDIKFNEF
ncbi:hypothetical protein J0B03_03740 [Alkalibacter rhizosphaerae]|uniref:Uncharacterized protein n=1 Tax=Alkalibacter rhizosphaerae TaxID=2815577 RepID=A0A974XG82_9FIRM|nr:DUF6544 family protein [Alkalibacter rhizosphaerae]QSX09191.1 hypothetical protein J0B03_03740 [Alkalibacter rhizosphaerae]